MKHFIFLYPIPEIIDFEIQRGAYGSIDESKENESLKRLKEARSEDEEESIKENALQASLSEFRNLYRTQLNACIDVRYRKNCFGITYAVFDGSPVSDVIDIQQSDRVIEVGLGFKTHTTKQPDGEYLYPDQDYILNQLSDVSVVRIAGFHMWDCVDKLAKRAYEKGLDTLVDEDLTEFFNGRLRDKDFLVDKYPSYNPRKDGKFMFDVFMEARKDKPWLWQDY